MSDILEINKIRKLRKNHSSLRIFWENFVFSEWDFFYKMPSFIWKIIFYKDLESYNELEKNFYFIKKYFWKDFKIADTQIFKDEKNHYVIKQKKIDWEILSIKQLKNNSNLKKKFQELMNINYKLWEKEWIYLDILWTDFIFKPTKIHNIIIDWKDLYIFDFWVLKKNSPNFIFRKLSNFFYWCQIFFIKKYILK